VKATAFVLAEIVALVVHNQLDNRTLGQSCRFIEYQPAFLDACSKTTHAIEFMARG